MEYFQDSCFYLLAGIKVYFTEVMLMLNALAVVRAFNSREMRALSG